MKITPTRHKPGLSRAGLTCAAALGLGMPVLSWAHSGADAAAHHGSSLMLGLLHPWSGLDHVLAMLAVGLWSALTARRVWLAPLVFVLMAGLGAVAAQSGALPPGWQPGVEAGVAASVLVLGLLLSLRLRLTPAIGLALVSGFALLHGGAHGSAFGGAGGVAVLGMLVSTAALHLAGVGLGLRLRQQHRLWTLTGGAAMALAGLGMLVQLS